MHNKRIIAFVMAGGQGSRLQPLTSTRSKPSVPFGARYRIVDFVLSNLVNSQIRTIYLLVQYKSQSLIEHVRRAWTISPLMQEQFVTVVPPQMLKGEFTEGAGPGIDMFSIRQPVGVAAGITPFNFPAMIPMWKMCPAIACGNAFILKPSERDPSVPIMLAELMIEAGLPPGILNFRFHCEQLEPHRYWDLIYAKAWKGNQRPGNSASSECKPGCNNNPKRLTLADSSYRLYHLG